MNVFNRIMCWKDTGVEYEADPRQGEKIVKELGLVGASKAGAPGVKMIYEDAVAEKELPRDKRTAFRGVGARSNYLAPDGPEIQYASKEVCRFMLKPTDQRVATLMRLGRYLEGRNIGV